MGRKLFTFAAAASAVLCIAVCLLWVRSYWVSERVSLTLGGPADDESRRLTAWAAQSNHGWFKFDYGYRFGGGWFESNEPFLRRVSPDQSETRLGYRATRPAGCCRN